MSGVDFGYFLNRKYAILQQEANATTKNANTNELTGTAQAGLDRTRTRLLPGESAASIARQGAETNLANQQASVVVPESRARVRNMDADTNYTGTQDRVLTRGSLTPFRSLFGDPESALGGVMGPGYTTSGIVPPNQFRAPRAQDYTTDRRGFTAAGLDYINGF